jgi:hypothetical protein
VSGSLDISPMLDLPRHVTPCIAINDKQPLILWHVASMKTFKTDTPEDSRTDATLAVPNIAMTSLDLFTKADKELTIN